MWSPTHIEVTILRARGLLTKGKNGTNNCFVTIGMDKEKYQTSVKDKAEPNVSWEEACELKIPDQGNRAELVLTCLHRNNLGLDEFLGQVTLPLNTMDVYERPRQKWFKLESKPGKEKKNKDRGEIEARISFIVKSGSLSDLSKKEKHKSSIGQLASSVGGSLLSIGQIEKRKGIKKFAKSLGSKMHLSSKKKIKDGDDGSSYNGSMASIGTPTSSNGIGSRTNRGQHAGDADPGVISEDEDEFVFDNLSHKSSASSINISRQNFVPKQSPLLSNGGKEFSKRDFDQQPELVDPELEQIENDFSIRAHTLPPPSKPPRTPHQYNGDTNTGKPLDEWESKLYGNHLEVGSVNSLKRRSWENNRVPLPAPIVEDYKEVDLPNKNIENIIQIQTSSSSSSEAEEEDKKEEEKKEEEKKEEKEVREKISVEQNQPFSEIVAKFEKPQDTKIAPPVAPRIRLMTQNNAKKHDTEPAFKAETKISPLLLPRALLRDREQKEEEQVVEKAEDTELKQREDEKQRALAEQRKILEVKEEEEKKRIQMIAKQKELEENRIREAKELEEQKRQKLEIEKNLRELDEKERLAVKRREEDQRLLSFAKRSISGESDVNSTSTPEQSPKERSAEKRDKRLSKFKYFSNKRDNNSSSPTSGERIIIGHEKSMTHAEKRTEISAALSKKYDGKSREELMLIANGMENEALMQRQRVKELEDYLDNLLLRVMETHPKILQNPYSRTTSAKSG